MLDHLNMKNMTFLLSEVKSSSNIIDEKLNMCETCKGFFDPIRCELKDLKN